MNHSSNLRRQTAAYSRRDTLSNKSKNHWTDHLVTPLLSGSYLFASLALFGLGQFFLAICFFFMWGITSPQVLATLLDRLPRIKAIHLNPFLSFTLAVGLAGGFLLGAGFFTPAHAQFLEAAEAGAVEIVTGLGGGGENLQGIVEFIFGALRLLLVIYMAIALIQIVNAARQGEEWKDLMRTPLMVILVVVVGDFIAGVIFGA
jgi:hypothetical protein